MTGTLDAIQFNWRDAENQLISFNGWLSGIDFVSETEIVNEIKARPQMACLLASTLGIHVPNRIKFELSLKGMFRTDLVLGHQVTQKFALTEFEGAEENSIFRKMGTSLYRYWSNQIEHGFGQIIDWAWIRSDHPGDSVLSATFGGAMFPSAYAVICGRNRGLRDDVERKRFNHRRNAVRIEGVPVLILTYDDMVEVMENTLVIAKTP